MAVTPNYSWPIPAATDYVKDGYDAIDDLGNAIDTSLNSITNGKNVGLVHLNTTSFSAVSSITVSNVFNATYDNYKITFSGISTANQDALMQMTANGTATTTGYYFAQVGVINGSSASDGGGANTSQWNMPYISTNSTDSEISLMSPYLSRHTKLYGDWMYNLPTDIIYRRMGAYLANTTSYDGFKITVASGTITGNIRIYGFRNS